MTTTIPPRPATLADLVPSDQVEAATGRKLLTLRRAADQGAFPAPIKLRGRYYWLADDLTAWIEQQRQACAEPASTTSAPIPEPVADAVTTTTPGGGAQ